MGLKNENKDLQVKTKEEIVDSINKATKEGNVDEQVNGMVDLMNYVAKDAAEQVVRAKRIANDDNAILVSRGVETLTSEETKYFKDLAKIMKGESSLQTTELIFPVTTVDRVFEELEEAHELLSVIDFHNVTGTIETIIRTGDVTPAWWGKLTDEVKKKLESGFDKKQVNLYKLSAYLPIAKAYLDLGPAWLETFIRRFIVEALSLGLEEAIVTGNGKDCPIGMNRDLKGSVVEGVYPEKAAIPIKNLKPNTYGRLVAMLTKNGKRTVKEVLLVVNPFDYFTKIFPAITVLNSMGSYISNVLPFPTKIVQSTAVAKNKAVFGVANIYYMGLGSEQKIEKSSEYHFVEDEDVYLGKLYGNGFPKDNDGFLNLDISEMETISLEPIVGENTEGTE